jgi:hypothetical protein
VRHDGKVLNLEGWITPRKGYLDEHGYMPIGEPICLLELIELAVKDQQGYQLCKML